MLSGRIVFVAVLGLAAGLAHAERYEAIDVRDGGTVLGVVRFVGHPPTRPRLVVDTHTEVCGGEEKFGEALLIDEDRGVKNVVVYLDGIRRGKSWEAGQYTLDQEGCRFAPHVLLVPAGADLAVANNDDILHMIRADGRKNPPFNVGQPKFNRRFTKTLHHPEIIKVTCDIHSWMSGYIVVQGHPYFTLTDAKGLFRLTDVPPGQYDLRFWHEVLGEKSGKVTVKPNEETTVDVRLTST